MTSPIDLKQRLKLLFFEGIDPIRLDTYRRCLAIAFLVYMSYLFGNAAEWLTDKGFHVTAETQLMHAAKPFPTMPTWMVPIFGVVLYGAGFCLIFGKFTRVALWVALACAVYVQRVDSLTAFAMNKLFIVGFAVMAFAPPARQVILSDGREVTLQSAWPVRVLQATLLIIYCTSGFCKAFLGDWLRDPYVVWTIVQGVFRTDFSAFMLQTMPKWVFSLVMYFVLVFEFFAPILFISKRLRPYAVIAGISFHIGLALMMSTVFFFSLQMITYYVLFLPDSTLHQARRWFKRGKKNGEPGHEPVAGPLTEIESIVFRDDVSDSQKVEQIQGILTRV